MMAISLYYNNGSRIRPIQISSGILNEKHELFLFKGEKTAQIIEGK